MKVFQRNIGQVLAVIGKLGIVIRKIEEDNKYG
jgi:hypothetical protein